MENVLELHFLLAPHSTHSHIHSCAHMHNDEKDYRKIKVLSLSYTYSHSWSFSCMFSKISNSNGLISVTEGKCDLQGII